MLDQNLLDNLKEKKQNKSFLNKKRYRSKEEQITDKINYLIS